MSYDKDAVTEKFNKGKALLDGGYNDEAISIFSQLIELSAPFKNSDEDARITWHTSLNNRGVARCNKGYSEGNKQLFQDGIKDYQTAIESVPEEQGREMLTASSNLKFAEQQLQDFDNLKDIKFQAS